jgi:hypothetical protein
LIFSRKMVHQTTLNAHLNQLLPHKHVKNFGTPV